MEVFAELLKDDVGLLSLIVLAITVGILGFFLVYFFAKSSKQ
jgi:hypothetical protein